MAGVTVTPVAVPVTVMVQLAVLVASPAAVAVTLMVEPAAAEESTFTSPVEALTVAGPEVTAQVTVWFALEGETVAVSCCVPPGATEAEAGEIETLETAAAETVMVQESV